MTTDEQPKTAEQPKATPNAKIAAVLAVTIPVLLVVQSMLTGVPIPDCGDIATESPAIEAPAADPEAPDPELKAEPADADDEPAAE